MGELQNIDLAISFSWFFMFAGAAALILFVLFVYRHTIPKISASAKAVIIFLRTMSLLLILWMIFEPVITFNYKRNVEPELGIFIDNSESVTYKDSLDRREKILRTVEHLKNETQHPVNVRVFSSVVKQSPDNPDSIIFNGSATNFSSVISYLNDSSKSAAAAVIISDGIMTDGSNPVYAAEKLQIPVFTLGTGDTASRRDISLKKITANEYTYLNKQTPVAVSVFNSGFSGITVSATLKDENKTVANKIVQLSETGTNNIVFDYTPAETGERKLSISLSPVEGEESRSNNAGIFYMNVLNDKLKIAMIAGSPSADLSIITSAVQEDKNNKVITSAEISGSKSYTDPGQKDPIDSSDVLFLINFPSATTPQSAIDRVMDAVTRKNKPFFILVTQLTDLNKLRNMEKVLPFSVNKISGDILQVQPEGLNPAFHSVFSISGAEKEIGNLPPVSRNSSEFIPKPESVTLIKSKSNNIPLNIPLIILRSLGNSRSFAFLAGDIWKWKLQTAESKSVFFDNLLNGIIKWLNASSKQKQFIVNTKKKTYAAEEQIEFTAQLYDQTFTPVDTANVMLSLANGEEKLSMPMTPTGSGIYTATFRPVQKGDYNYSATADINGFTLSTGGSKFNIGDIDIEIQNTRMDSDLLKQLATATGGAYADIDNYDAVKKQIASVLNNSSKDIKSSAEFKMWSSEWILILILCLFAVEWFLRKRLGML